MYRHTKNRVNNHERQGGRSVVIQITTTPQLIELLDCVLATGFFGNSRAAAAERILAEGIRGLLKEGVTQKRRKAVEE